LSVFFVLLNRYYGAHIKHSCEIISGFADSLSCEISRSLGANAPPPVFP
jgi:hypothetical protein